MGHGAAVLSLAMATVVPCLLWACGPSEVSCDDVCSCQGRADDATCTSECINRHADEKEAAQENGCEMRYVDFQACLADNSVCDEKKKELVVPVGACSAALETLINCEFPQTQTTSSSASSSTGSAM